MPATYQPTEHHDMTETTNTNKRAPLRPKLHLVTDKVTGVEYLVRAKTNAGAIAAVSSRYESRAATADDVDERRDLEVIEAGEQDEAQGDLIGGAT
jgi:hypothetical protein